MNPRRLRLGAASMLVPALITFAPLPAAAAQQDTSAPAGRRHATAPAHSVRPGQQESSAPAGGRHATAPAHSVRPGQPDSPALAAGQHMTASTLSSLPAPQDRPRLPEGHSPQGALWRAAVLPGWGQAYNRQYLKIPIVYAGLGGIAGLALFTNHRYLTFRRAFLYAVRTSDFPEYESNYVRARSLMGLPGDGLTESEKQRISSTLRGNRDILRRNRDLLYIGIGLFYGLTVLDAYVNAHLLDFDVGEDLTLSLRPVPDGLTASVKFDL